jgi:hypothetical protein
MRRRLIGFAAMAATCAGPVAAQPDATPAAPPVGPIPGAGAWVLAGPGQPTECTARVNGAQIDTMMTANNDGRMVLIAGRPDWNNPGATAPALLQVDRQRPRKVTGSYVANLYLVLVTDDAVLKALEGARQLTWTMKAGKFQADVTGLGAAFAAVQACKASLPASPS